MSTLKTNQLSNLAADFVIDVKEVQPVAEAYTSLGAYGAGLVFNSYTETFTSDGVEYRPLTTLALPYTTTGVGAGEIASFRSVGDAILRSDLAEDSDPLLGSVLVGRASIVVTSIAQMQAYAVPAGRSFSLNAGGRSGVFDVIAGDFSAELVADTLNGIYVGLADNPTASSKVAKRRFSGLTPGMFGAYEDGSSDDTAPLKAMFAAGDGNKIVISKHSRLLPDDVWEGGFFVEDNCTVEFVGDGKLSMLPHNSNRYGILKLVESYNVTLINPNLDGRKDLNSSVTSEFGHGIELLGTVGLIKIVNPVTVNMWGDGILISGAPDRYVTDGRKFSEDFVITNPLADGCRRQGMSITSAKHGTVTDALWKNISGALPECGLDIEPNTNADELYDINIIRPRTENCNKYGILIFLANMTGAVAKEIKIVIDDHVDYGSSSGLVLQSLLVQAGQLEPTGSINVNRPVYTKNKLGGIVASGWQKTSLLTSLVSPKIVDWNVSDYAAADFGSALSIIVDTGSALSSAMGGIKVTDRIFIDTVGNGKGNDYVVNKVTGLVEGVEILESGNFLPTKTSQYSNSGIKTTDFAQRYKQTLNASANIAVSQIQTILNDVGYPSVRVYTLPASVSNSFDRAITFINNRQGESTGGMKIVPPVGGKFLGQAVDAGYQCALSQGHEITVSHVDANVWRVDRLIGEWTVL